MSTGKKDDQIAEQKTHISLGTALIVISVFVLAICLAYSFGSLSAKNAELRTHIEYRDKEIEYLRGQVNSLQEKLVGEKVENKVLESALGLLPDPNDPIAMETARVAKRNVLAHAETDDWERTYKYLVAIGYKETRFDNDAVGAAGEKSTWQVMPMHLRKVPKELHQHPDIGAKYAIKVLYDFSIPSNPSRLHRYNGQKSDVTMAYQRSVFRYVDKFFG